MLNIFLSFFIHKYVIFINLFILYNIVCEAVKIKSITVPSTYILDDDAVDPQPLILDCIYDVGPKESGFVLKWYLNNIQIYQWIPSRAPFALVS